MSDKQPSWFWPECASPGFLRGEVSAYLRETAQLALPQLERGEGTSHSLRSLLRHAATSSPRGTLECFASPFVAVPVRAARQLSTWPHLSSSIRRSLAHVAPHLLMELTARRLLPKGEAICWTASAPPLSSPFHSLTIHPPRDATGWVFANGTLGALCPEGRTARIPLEKDCNFPAENEAGFRCEEAYVELAHGIKLCLVDPNPLSSWGDHPQRGANVLDLGGKPVAEWKEALRKALLWIADATPHLFAEIQQVIRFIVPIGFQPEKHFSSTYREALGTIYLTLHPDPLILAEAIVHEFQHNKLYLLRRRDPILHNALHPLYRSPVRPDPRPLWGILLAAHAFLAVALFFRALEKQGHPAASSPIFEARLYDVDCKNHEAIQTLARHARWTKPGARLFQELRSCDRRHVRYWEERGATLHTSLAHSD